MPQKYYFGTRHFYFGEEWVKAGHEVTIFTANNSHLTDRLPRFKGKALRENINGVNTFWLNTYRSERSSGLKRILSWIHFEWQLLTVRKDIRKPDVVYISSLSLLTIINAYYYSRRFKAKLVFEVRDIWPLTAVVLGGYRKWHPFIAFLSFLEKWGYKKADLVVGTMPNHIEHVRNVVSKVRKWICIPQGISPGFYSNEQVCLPEEYKIRNIPSRKFIVAYAGTLNANNPLDTLLEAADILSADSSIHFLIIGQGDQWEALHQLAKDMKNLSVLPAIPKNQVNDLLQQCNLFYDSIDSRLAQYGLSRNKWIDYMMAARPIVCSYNGFQSMINEAQCGSFVPYGDARALAGCIKRYSEMPSEDLLAIGRRGRDFLMEHRQFSILAKKYLNAIFESQPR